MNKILYETPYEKFLRFGPENLTDSELLAILLRTGSVNEDVLQLSNRLLESKDSSKNIIGLTYYKYEELIKISGIGKIKAMCICSLLELSKRIAVQQRKKLLDFSQSKTVADYYMESLRHLEYECVKLLLLDNKCNLIGDVLLSTGTVNYSVVSTRDIFRNALAHNATAVILIHNHPSGDPTPGNNDYIVTAKLKSAGELMDIPLLDHIVIGDLQYFSFKAMGYI